ncbi:hypothetical protein D6D25_07920 [Aureobasidium pullulans]|nr:hypothetical protein D6D25_07920 [Aureobasidium pullulans]
MSPAQDGPVILKYRPAFALPGLLENEAPNRYQSFSILPGYHNVSFEEQRLHDTEKPVPSILHHFGMFSQKSLEVLQTGVRVAPQQKTNQRVLDFISPSGPLATILVGSSEAHTEFHVHINVLAHCSPYFQAASKKEWWIIQDGQTFMSLEDDPSTFAIYVEWVYAGRIWRKTQPHDFQDTEFLGLVRAWILGDKFLDHRFKNAVVDCLIAKIAEEGRLDLTLPQVVYDNTLQDAPLRRLLVDLYVWHGHKDWVVYPITTDCKPAAFLSDLSTALFERHSQAAFLKDQCPPFNLCMYHMHPEGDLNARGCTSVHPREILAAES